MMSGVPHLGRIAAGPQAVACGPQHGSAADRALSVQEDIEDVSRTARQVKNRLERLDKVNEQALSRKVRLAGPVASVVTMSRRT